MKPIPDAFATTLVVYILNNFSEAQSRQSIKYTSYMAFCFFVISKVASIICGAIANECYIAMQIQKSDREFSRYDAFEKL